MFGLSVDPRTQIELLVEGAGPSERFPSEGPTAWAHAGRSRSPPNGPGPARSRALVATAAVLWRGARDPRKGGGAAAATPAGPTPPPGVSPPPPATHGTRA